MVALFTFLAALALAYLGTRILLRVRLDRGFVDVPNERSSHEAPKPRFGGIAIFAAFAIVFLCLLIKEPGSRVYLPILLGGAIAFLAGVVDDWRSLSIIWRLLAQGLAVATVVGSGHVVRELYLPLAGTIELGPIAVPFTILFIVTSINFYNFIDGIDGLAAGSAFIAAAFLSYIVYTLGHPALALICLTIAGSTLGFLQFNFPPSRLFMGDGGSTFLGFVFASIAVIGNGQSPQLPFFVPVLLLSSLYLDAGLTLTRRAIKGEKIFQPHHMHYYQRMLSLGLNHKQVTVLEYGITVLLGISALIFFKAGSFFSLFLTLCWIVVFTASILKIRSSERGDRLFWERRSLLVVAGDLLLITAAYFGAYFLRMNFRFTEAEGMAVLKAFPIVIVVRSLCFFYYGLYRTVWKYTSTPDVLRIIKAVTTGSAIIVVLLVLLNRFVSVPRSLFLIEFFLLIVGLCGSRFASRLFHEFGKEALGASARRVAIIGAGDYGERLGREIRNTDGKKVVVACHIDDDRGKDGLTLQGVPIVGPIDRLSEICETYKIDALALGISALPERKLVRIVEAARDAGVPIDTHAGLYVPKQQPAFVLFDQISRAAERDLPMDCKPTSASFFLGKRVLITNGGLALGPALANRLVAAGAEVVVQIATPMENERYADSVGERCQLYVGPFERELDVQRALETAMPRVVFHCVPLDVDEAINEFDSSWRCVVRGTDALCKVLPKYAIESFCMISFWGRTTVADPRSALAAVAEVRALNSANVLPSSPKAIRMPGVLTTTRLRRILARGEQAREDADYALLEPEAIALCLDTAAAYKGRAILLPKSLGAVTAGEIVSLFGVRSGAASLARASGVDASRHLFATESRKASVLAAASEVATPVYPADEWLEDATSQCINAASADSVGPLLENVRTMLLGGVGRKTQSSIE